MNAENGNLKKVYYPIEEQLSDCYSFLGIPWNDGLDEENMSVIENRLSDLFVWVEHPDFIQHVPQFKANGQFPFQGQHPYQGQYQYQVQKADTALDEYTKLLLAEQTCHTIEIREKSTGKEGVANTYKKGVANTPTGDVANTRREGVSASRPEGVELFFGADDGSDDKVVSAEEFSRDFEITAMIMD